MIRTIGAYAAKTHLPQLLKQVARGEQILITRRGKPVALLSPPPERDEEAICNTIEELKAYSKKQGRTLGGLTFRELIEEGRR